MERGTPGLRPSSHLLSRSRENIPRLSVAIFFAFVPRKDISEPTALNSRAQHRNLEENPASFFRNHLSPCAPIYLFVGWVDHSFRPTAGGPAELVTRNRWP